MSLRTTFIEHLKGIGEEQHWARHCASSAGSLVKKVGSDLGPRVRNEKEKLPHLFLRHGGYAEGVRGD